MGKQIVNVEFGGVNVEVETEVSELPTNSQAKCTVLHMRNGKVINTITPYSDAGIFGKLLYHIGLRNYTR